MSEDEEDADLSTMDIILLACCPVDRSKLPPGPELNAIVITELYTIMQCENPDCGFGNDIWVGPRQFKAYRENWEKAYLFCYVCAMIAQEQETLGQADWKKVASLGGGFPVEGSPRRG